MGKVIWNKETGQSREYEGVDAREILRNSPDLYTDVNPEAKSRAAKDPDDDGLEGAPQNVANVENEFRREPVGMNPPAKEREQVIIRNPVTDVPQMAVPAGLEVKTPDEHAKKAAADRAERLAVDKEAATKRAAIDKEAADKLAAAKAAAERK